MKSKTECCNGNCNQGRDCPMRNTKKTRVKTTIHLTDIGSLHESHTPQIKKWWGWSNIYQHTEGLAVIFYGPEGKQKAIEFLQNYNEYPKTEYKYL
jgi:hypothetical protein